MAVCKECGKDIYGGDLCHKCVHKQKLILDLISQLGSGVYELVKTKGE